MFACTLVQLYIYSVPVETRYYSLDPPLRKLHVKKTGVGHKPGGLKKKAAPWQPPCSANTAADEQSTNTRSADPKAPQFFLRVHVPFLDVLPACYNACVVGIIKFGCGTCNSPWSVSRRRDRAGGKPVSK